jgi:hypothetical protein
VWSELTLYRSAPPHRKRLLWEALFSLALARIAMACLPFRRIAAWMGAPGAQTPDAASQETTRIAEEIGWAVSALGPRVPWDGRCLAQALAANFMLRRRGLEGTISFGVNKDESGELIAHAWLRFGSSYVTGGAGDKTFSILTTFARKRP